MTDDQARVAEWLFVKTYEDLERRAKSQTIDRYQLLGCAGLLRKLLLDQQPLLDRVNTRYRLSLPFHAQEMKKSHPRGLSADYLYWMQGSHILPGHDSTPLKTYKRPDWVRHKVGQCPEGNITVGDLIKFASHVEGGVHAGRPSTPVEKALQRLTPSLIEDDIPEEVTVSSPIGQLMYVSGVTLSGMFPLYLLLSSNLGDVYRLPDR